MTLNDNDIKDFQRIYKETYGKEISKEEAYIKWMALIQLMEIVLTTDFDLSWQNLKFY